MTRRVILIVHVCAGLLLAAAIRWHFRFHSSPDGVSYLEIAEKISLGHWREAVNSNWSPLYSWFLSPLFVCFSDRRLLILPAAHLLQAGFAAFSLWATWRLLKPALPDGQEENFKFIGRVFVLATALWCALAVVPPTYLTPDILVMIFVLWMVGRLSEETEGAHSFLRFFVTGLLAGCGYLTKTYVFVYAAGLYLGIILSDRSGRSFLYQLKRATGYAAGFLAIAGPWIAALSYVKGRFSMGESGWINFLGHSLMASFGESKFSLSHFVKVHELSFPTILPQNYEPHLATVTAFHPTPLLAAKLIARNICATFFGYYPPDHAMYWPLGILGVLAVSVWLSAGRSKDAGDRKSLFLLWASLWGFLLFLSIHVESRYLAPFPVILAAGIVGLCARLHNGTKQFAGRLLTGLAVLFVMFPLFFLINGLRSSQGGSRSDGKNLILSSRWMERGGTRYAVVGSTYNFGLPAWLSKSHLVASVEKQGLTADHCAETTSRLRGAGVHAVLSTAGYTDCGEWKTIPGSDSFYWKISSSEGPREA